MNDLKERKQLSHVILQDWRTLVSESSVSEIYNHLQDNQFIMICGEAHSKYAIKSVIPAKLDDLEWYILSQPKEIQEKLRVKQQWLKANMPDPMDLKYAQNYVKNLSL